MHSRTTKGKARKQGSKERKVEMFSRSNGCSSVKPQSAVMEVKSDAGGEKAGDQQFFFTEVTFTTKSQMNPRGPVDKKLKSHRGEVFVKCEN